jgi:hypothetical protein
MSDPLTDPPPPPANPPPTLPAAPFPIPPFVPGPPPVSGPEPPPPAVVIQRYFSPSTLGFYSDEPNAAPIPVDAVPISTILWQQLLLDNVAGKQIAFDVGTQLPISITLGATLNGVRGKFLSLMRLTDWTQSQETPAVIRIQFRNYRDALRFLITHLPPDLNTIVWPVRPTIVDPEWQRFFP